MSYSTRGNGGGGGFGGFPYRSSHQQGNDHPNNNNNGGRGRRRNNRPQKGKAQQRRERGGPLIFSVRLDVLIDDYPLIIGKGGKTVEGISDRTKCLIDVPRRNNRRQVNAENNELNSVSRSDEREVENKGRVTIRSSCIEYLLNGCLEISLILSRDVEYCMYIHNKKWTKGILKYQPYYAMVDKGDSLSELGCFGGLFMSVDSILEGDTNENKMSAYIIYSTLTKDEMEILIDNQRFVDKTLQAFTFIAEKFPKEETSSTTVTFIYGTDEQKPLSLYKNVCENLTSSS